MCSFGLSTTERREAHPEPRALSLPTTDSTPTPPFTTNTPTHRKGCRVTVKRADRKQRCLAHCGGVWVLVDNLSSLLVPTSQGPWRKPAPSGTVFASTGRDWASYMPRFVNHVCIASFLALHVSVCAGVCFVNVPVSVDITYCCCCGFLTVWPPVVVSYHPCHCLMILLLLSSPLLLLIVVVVSCCCCYCCCRRMRLSRIVVVDVGVIARKFVL